MEGDFGTMKSTLDRLRADLDNIEPLHLEAITEIRRNNTLLIDERIGDVSGESERLKGRVVRLEGQVEVINKDLVEKEQRIAIVDERVVVVDQERRDNDKMLGRGIKETSKRNIFYRRYERLIFP